MPAPRSAHAARAPRDTSPTIPVLAIEPGGVRVAELRTRAALFRPNARVTITPSALSSDATTEACPRELEVRAQRFNGVTALFLLEDWMSGRPGAVLFDDPGFGALVRWPGFQSDADGRFTGTLELRSLEGDGVL